MKLLRAAGADIMLVLDTLIFGRIAALREKERQEIIHEWFQKGFHLGQQERRESAIAENPDQIELPPEVL